MRFEGIAAPKKRIEGLVLKSTSRGIGRSKRSLATGMPYLSSTNLMEGSRLPSVWSGNRTRVQLHRQCH